MSDDTTKDEAPRDWLVLCLEHGDRDTCLWWRPNSCGYTTDLDKAGRYTKAEAVSRACGEDRDETGGKREWAVPLAEAEALVRRIVPLESIKGAGLARWQRNRRPGGMDFEPEHADGTQERAS